MNQNKVMSAELKTAEQYLFDMLGADSYTSIDVEELKQRDSAIRKAAFEKLAALCHDIAKQEEIRIGGPNNYCKGALFCRDAILALARKEKV